MFLRCLIVSAFLLLTGHKTQASSLEGDYVAADSCQPEGCTHLSLDTKGKLLQYAFGFIASGTWVIDKDILTTQLDAVPSPVYLVASVDPTQSANSASVDISSTASYQAAIDFPTPSASFTNSQKNWQRVANDHANCLSQATIQTAPTGTMRIWLPSKQSIENGDATQGTTYHFALDKRWNHYEVIYSNDYEALTAPNYYKITANGLIPLNAVDDSDAFPPTQSVLRQKPLPGESKEIFHALNHPTDRPAKGVHPDITELVNYFKNQKTPPENYILPTQTPNQPKPHLATEQPLFEFTCAVK